MNADQLIREQLAKQGSMPFVEFMHQALYAPNVGYYSSGLEKLGAAGDFITAPELSPLFGQTLAHQCQQVLALLHEPILFEFGAGSGRLAVDLLKALEHLHSLPKAYHILEVSANLRARQFKLLQKETPHLLPLIHWHNQWPEKPFQGILLANEVLDAMPVHRFQQTVRGIEEGYVKLNTEGEWVEFFKPSTNQPLLAKLNTVLPKVLLPYQSEINLFLDDWLKQCSTMLEKGAFFIIDYGFPRHEYYHSERAQGTLMCHYRHQAHSNPFLHVGEQDITAHVDFTHVAEAGSDAGFRVAGYCNQASFLLANGLLSLLEKIKGEREKLTANQAVKQMLLPSEMGELFKVIALTKKIDVPLTGFQLQDKRASL